MKERNAQMKIRFLVPIHILQGRNVAEISKFLLLSRTQVYYWWKRYREEGMNGLEGRKKTGRPRIIDEQILREALSEPSKKYGFAEWTHDTIMQFLSDQGYHIHRNYLYHILKKIGWRRERKIKQMTRGGSYITEQHLEMMKRVSKMLDAPVDRIITEGGISPVLMVTQSSKYKTIVEGETERGKLTIIYEENMALSNLKRGE